ncbi:NAD(P)H-hydrate epimerase [Gryllotalpicola protaetiae]|uniref:NAD(P)H-hydrate epimerase n=1 Tax=Gryllotalpicola protaetiae TaxID=2419771 RepID=A0A387BH51_9MICO|nr:NAD(P)H-hydrate epimerase [Gryllotalpicola protaetiae]AYG03345.1 NAD(P)H-hydrate epimerase [Gryllotalpicola protaetiae]
MKGYGAQQVRDAEAPHLAAGEPLMARAAAALARVCEELLTDGGLALAHARVVMIIGGGNNGGDALYAAAHLATARVTVELVRTSSRVHEEGLTAALAAGATELTGPPAKLAARAKSADLIVDGILGTGTSANPRLRGAARDLVAALAPMVESRRSRDSKPGSPQDRFETTPAAPPQRPGWPKVVAVDIPSGIHPDTGEVPDPEAVLTADVTVTFGGAKAGLLIEPGASFAGGIRLFEIGLAADLGKLTPLLDSPEG